MNFTIKGTRTASNDAPGLCFSCRAAHITQGTRQSDERILCSALFGPAYPIEHKITDCTSYSSRSTTALDDYEKIAWKFSVDNHRSRSAGFLTPDKYKEMKKDTGNEDDEGLVAPWDR